MELSVWNWLMERRNVCFPFPIMVRGISEEDYVKIFERFYQVENIGQYGGTGIGLALSQGIVKAHQGDITVESQLGKGSLF